MSVFSSIPVPKKGSTNFDESHSVSGTFPLSQLCPVFWCETIPGDRWKINVFNHTKLETLIAPAMQQVDASLLWFKLPKRLCFKHFKKWYSGGSDGKDNHEKPHIHLMDFFYEVKTTLDNFFQSLDPQLASANIQKFTEDLFGPGTLWNYMGLPMPLKYDSSTGSWSVRSMEDFDYQGAQGYNGDEDFCDLIPLIGYNLIYDCYFRDQTLSDGVFEDADEGVLILNKSSYFRKWKDSTGRTFDLNIDPTGLDISEGGELDYADVLYLLILHRRAWKKDYFTSALPSPQRGPEVKINMFDGQTLNVDNPEDGFELEGQNVPGGTAATETFIGSDTSDKIGVQDSGDYTQLKFKTTGGNLSVDMSGLSPMAITAFRNLFKLQAFLEKNNIGGGRFIETILAQWGERVPDFTVQRPQFVRATSIPVQITEVLATANSSGVNSQVGDQAGHASVRGNLGNVRIYTHEPSLIFGLYCVGIPPTYVNQGLPRFFQHVTRFDEPWTDFQHIGEQNIKSRELYFPFENLQSLDEDFGYQQRFSEYKYMPDRVVGDFSTSLSYWHMARMFNVSPTLNEDFVMQHPDERIFAVKNARPVFSDFFFRAFARRKLSKYSTPKLT